MTDPERAAFVEWFAERLTHDDFMDPGGDLWGDEVHRRSIAELAAQAVEKAVKEALRLECERVTGCPPAPIPWRAAMETAEVSDTPSANEGRGSAEPPQIPHIHWAASLGYPAHCCKPCYDAGRRESYADCERIAREEGKRWSLGYKAFSESLADAIAAKRKEVCGE